MQKKKKKKKVLPLGKTSLLETAVLSKNHRLHGALLFAPLPLPHLCTAHPESVCGRRASIFGLCSPCCLQCTKGNSPKNNIFSEQQTSPLAVSSTEGLKVRFIEREEGGGETAQARIDQMQSAHRATSIPPSSSLCPVVVAGDRLVAQEP